MRIVEERCTEDIVGRLCSARFGSENSHAVFRLHRDAHVARPEAKGYSAGSN